MTLKTICDYIIRYIRACLYPRSIFKKRGYVDTISLSQISQEVNLMSIRRISKPFEIIDFNGVKVFDMPIEDNEIVDMSMNLLGGKWTLKNLHYADKDKVEHSHEYPGFFYTVFHPNSVAYFKEAYPLNIRVNDLNGRQFIYPILFENKNQRNAFFKRYPVDDEKYLAEDLNSKDAYEVKCVITHKPTFLNYWHCVLNLTLDGTLLEKQPNSYKKVASAFLEKLLKPAVINAYSDNNDHSIPCHLFKIQ